MHVRQETNAKLHINISFVVSDTHILLETNYPLDLRKKCMMKRLNEHCQWLYEWPTNYVDQSEAMEDPL